MFASVARSYDRANQVLSLGMHHRWRRAAVRSSGAAPGDRVLDCATGTGDLAIEFRRAVGPEGEVIGADFCEEMLALGPAKAARAGAPVRFEVADLLALPYADGAFDVVSVAFGIRNVE
ncbi:MAG TPA: class I SAM-dependent methyltransferase, partial [Candidatus Eisenbacteria bacterium]|nr:class I SAM-dependent methyltransferase [Candidatus Eisenbacteria bacterium]